MLPDCWIVRVYDKMKAYCEVAIFYCARDYLKYTFERRLMNKVLAQ